MSFLAILCAMLSMLGTVVCLAAEPLEFRCDSEIFMAKEKQPIMASLTIFSGNMVYDFHLGAPEEITT
jgi:hypothetical protein